MDDETREEFRKMNDRFDKLSSEMAQRFHAIDVSISELRLEVNDLIRNEIKVKGEQ